MAHHHWFQIFWGHDPDFASNKIALERFQNTSCALEFKTMGDISLLIAQLICFCVTGEFSPLTSSAPVFCTMETEPSAWLKLPSLLECCHPALQRPGMSWKSFSYQLLILGSWKFGVLWCISLSSLPMSPITLHILWGGRFALERVFVSLKEKCFSAFLPSASCFGYINFYTH